METFTYGFSYFLADSGSPSFAKKWFSKTMVQMCLNLLFKVVTGSVVTDKGKWFQTKLGDSDWI